MAITVTVFLTSTSCLTENRKRSLLNVALPATAIEHERQAEQRTVLFSVLLAAVVATSAVPAFKWPCSGLWGCASAWSIMLYILPPPRAANPPSPWNSILCSDGENRTCSNNHKRLPRVRLREPHFQKKENVSSGTMCFSVQQRHEEVFVCMYVHTQSACESIEVQPVSI